MQGPIVDKSSCDVCVYADMAQLQHVCHIISDIVAGHLTL